MWRCLGEFHGSRFVCFHPCCCAVGLHGLYIVSNVDQNSQLFSVPIHLGGNRVEMSFGC